MTLSVLYKIILLAFLEPVIDQNLYYMGMKYTTATFTSAMGNVLPAITFVLAWALRLERVNIRRLQGQAKIVGTLVTVGGAMIMTLAKGSVIGLPWTKPKPNSQSDDELKAHQDPIKGAILITAACFCWSIFYILQATTLKSYPAGLSLTSLICMAGALQGAVLTLAVERCNTAIWSIGWDIKLVAYVYGGIMCSAITYYVSGVIMEEKGPVFVTSFNPLNMVIVAVLSSFILAEQLDVGKVAGAMVIVIGLYLVIWGKSKDEKEFFYAETEIVGQQNATSIDNLSAKSTISGDTVV
ncbi:nodulin MtN21 /EamA-like transporter family protein [Striga asiatica]|uniref:WAT1-related protein n=1 Tax=Striga asiatica TaxID=4170 RepID=A0A5A7PDJ4_STRAF|nr:nodulin MtN21 /EamA-like transporter family protein [Striga asiatica]